jgi:hypothetical protein
MFMMEKLMKAMVLSCVKATELLEMKEHIPLSFLKTMQLHMHTAMCSDCRDYMKQRHLIDELLQKNFSGVPFVENTDKLDVSIISKIE